MLFSRAKTVHPDPVEWGVLGRSCFDKPVLSEAHPSTGSGRTEKDDKLVHSYPL